MRIGVDLDGVCYEWQRTVLYMMRAYRGYTREQASEVEKWTDWNWHKKAFKPEDVDWLWAEGVKKGLFRYGHLYPGTITALNKLAAAGHDLVVLTHRPKNAVQDTLDWVSFNKLPVAEIHIISNQAPKSSIRPHCDYYIDDAAHNIRDFETNTMGCALLWTRPWNENFIGHKRVSSWDEVVGRIGQ